MSRAGRAAVVAEAAGWLGTPWHHRARVKGAGVDCIQFVIAVFSACGLCPAIDTGDYSRDWMLHRDDELILDGLRQYAWEIERPGLGDIVVYRFGRTFSHVGIFSAPDRIIHAYLAESEVIIGHPDGGQLAGRERKYFSVWSKS